MPEAQLNADAEVNALTDRVLIPELNAPMEASIADLVVKLRPLPLKHAKIVQKQVEWLESVDPNEKVLSTLLKIADTYAAITLHLLSFYGHSGYDREWLEEHCDPNEMRLFIERQLAVEATHNFLRTTLSLFCTTADKLDQLADQFRSQLSSSALLNPGTSAPLNSSSDTPKDS